MKNAPSISSHEPIIPHEQFILIEHSEEPHMHNPEKDDIVVTQKSMRQRTTKSFGDDYIVYLVDDIPRTIEEHILLLMLTCGRKQYGVRWIQLCLMELENLLNVLMGVHQ